MPPPASAAGAVLSLISSDYSDSIEYADGAIGDVYGKVLEDQGWYNQGGGNRGSGTG